MPHLRWIPIMAAGVAICHPPISSAATLPPTAPNIVFILADNLGWGELGVYGGGALRGALTPAIDQLSSQGLRLLNYNVEASCAPTRSALMTGRYPIRSGTLRSPLPGERNGLVRWEITIAQLLSEKGYATAMFGKWHLGDEQGRFPSDRGFDEWYGIPRTTDETLNRQSPQYDPSIVPPEFVLEGRRGSPSQKVEEYTVEVRRRIDTAITHKAIDFMNRSVAAHRKFYLYLPLTQLHFPTLPSHEFAGRSGNGDFADSMLETDYHVAELLKDIDQLNISDNTLVVFCSDNGPEYRRPWRGTAGYWTGTYHTALEGSLRAPCIIRWPGKIPIAVSNELVHAVDFFTTFARLADAPIPVDRPIDGVDQLDFFEGKSAKSNREMVPAFVEDQLCAIKWRNWKYHLIWIPEAAAKPTRLDKPYLFNLILDPKEESPRSLLEDRWVMVPITKAIRDLNASLERYPPIPFGAADPYTPSTPKPEAH